VNLPNWITVGRIILIPFFLVISYGDSDTLAVAAFVVFVVASASDRLDGYVARRQNLVSRTGAWLDPLADKLLVGAALVVLVDTRSFPLWAALIIGVREVAVLLLRTKIVSSGGALPASPAAKTKTVVQLGMVSWWLLPWNDVGWAHWVWLGAALVTTLWSGAEYFRRAEHATEVAP
jgi:CDP-diacylglycerol--glycerol-3-phosphate 3-phosphatidyltransferase